VHHKPITHSDKKTGRRILQKWLLARLPAIIDADLLISGAQQTMSRLHRQAWCGWAAKHAITEHKKLAVLLQQSALYSVW
jgi:hypothetical protein